VPDGVGFLVVAVDVQADRVEYQVKGFGTGEESWLVTCGQVITAPSAPAKSWLELDHLLRQEWEHAGGEKVRIE
jgi:phage terminase large subunit GpA-like protein